jgi:hypothetical protein
MADKQIAHLQAAWLKDLFNKYRRRPILTQHIGGELASHFAADMNPKAALPFESAVPCAVLCSDRTCFLASFVPEPVSRS